MIGKSTKRRNIVKSARESYKMNNLQIELKRQKEKEPNKTTNEIFIELYLGFKGKCLKYGIEGVDEVIKLFEVWTRTCS